MNSETAAAASIAPRPPAGRDESPAASGGPWRGYRPSFLATAAAAVLATLLSAPTDAGAESALERMDRELRDTFGRSAGFVYKVAAFESGRQGSSRVGSGFVLEGIGGIVTTEDLVAGGSHACVWIDGEARETPVIGSDPMLNVALLAMPEPRDAAGLPPGDSKEIQPGSFVVAIGYAGDFGSEPALGLVAGRRFGVFHLGGLPAWHLRVSMPLLPEQLGGPLLSSRGEVIGMTLGNAADSAHVYALASETLLPVVRIIEERGGTVEHGWIGVRVEPAAAAGPGSPPGGVRVGEIRLRSPASGAGLQRDDRILGIDGRPVRFVPDMFDIMLGMEIGHIAEIAVAREGETHTIPVTIGARPANRVMPPVTLPAEPFAPLPFGTDTGVGEILLPPMPEPTERP